MPRDAKPQGMAAKRGAAAKPTAKKAAKKTAKKR
jgi:hypothetical protein